MATDTPFLHDGSMTTASADLSAKQFYAVKITAARVVGLVAAVTDITYGILQNKPKSAQVCDVALFGIVKAVAGGSITAGDKLEVNSSGQVITYTTSGTACIIGQALETAVSAQVFTMYLKGPQLQGLT